MKRAASLDFRQWPEWFARKASGLVCLMGVLVLLGCTFNITAFKSILPKWPTMAPGTALALVLAGIALLILTGDLARLSVPPGGEKRKPMRRLTVQGCAGIVALIGLLKMGALLTRWDPGIDHLFFMDSPSAALGHIAPASALNLLLFGCALFLATGSRLPRTFQLLTLLCGLIGWLGFSHFLYGGEALLPYEKMAIHTAAAFVILSAALLCMRTDTGLMALLISDSAGGLVARRVLPPALLAPIVLGWLRLQGQSAGWYGTQAGTSLFALSNVIVFGVLVWAAAALLHRSDIGRRKAEQSVGASEERTRLIVETAMDAVITIDSGGSINGWNPQAETTFGWTRQEAVGRLLAEIIIPERDREAHRRGINRYLKTGEASVLNKRIELIALHRDGHEIPVELSITPIRIGNALAFSAFVRDITDRKRAEAGLRRSEERFRTMADSAPVMIWVSGTDKFCTWFNRQWLDFVGRMMDQELGNGWTENVHPDDYDYCLQVYTLAFDAREPFSMEYRLRRHDGKWRWVLDHGAACYGADEEFTGYIGSCIDITERKQSEQKLQIQLGRLDLLNRITRAIGEREDLQSIFQVVISSLEDNLPIDFGCAFLYEIEDDALTLASAGLRSKPLALELAMPEQTRIAIDWNRLSRCVGGQLEYKGDVSQVRLSFPQRLARGGLRSVVAAPLLVESKVFGVLLSARQRPYSFSGDECEFLRQLSEHVALAAHQAQLHGALQRAYDDLRQTQQAAMQQERLRALGQMASGIAHDINNAISPVALYTESLLEKEPNLSARTRDYLETIQYAVEDVAQTVARMREFYRQREPQFALVPVHLNRLAQQVLDLTRARWSGMPQLRGIVIKIVTELDPDLPVVLGIESEIREALINLIFNAVDAMPEGGTLTLRTRATESPPESAETRGSRRALLEVADTGLGMDEDTSIRAMEPFFTTKGERGTGLGLAMVYGMVRRHSAEIEIESEVDKGTTVRIGFLVSVDSVSVHAQPARASLAHSQLRILVVDDDPVLLKSLRNTLEADGHFVFTANTGQGGIDTFRRAQVRGEPFALVITDLGMPYLDGSKVAHAVKHASPSTSVVLLTGWGQRLMSEEKLPPNVDRVLNKPPKLSELREALAHCCRAADPDIF